MGKLAALKTLVEKADVVLVGGGMANHFVAALGLPVGDSLLETEGVPVARQILDRCKERGVSLVLPSDFVVAPSLEKAGEAKTVAMNAIPPDAAAFDVGPKTLEMFRRMTRDAKTIFWNGPMGVFETKPFDAGHARRREDPGRVLRLHRRGRRRERRGREGGGARRLDLARVDRRRRVARPRRGRGAARRRGPALTPMAPAPRRRELEDVPDAVGGRGARSRDRRASRVPAGVDVAIAPSFPALDRVGRRFSGTGIALAAQDVSPETRGRVHGRGLGGDPEGRRRLARPRRATASAASSGASARPDFARKIERLVEDGLAPLYCVGETRAEREAGRTRSPPRPARRARRVRGAPSGPRARVRAGLGDRDGARRDARDGRGRARASCARSSRRAWARRPPRSIRILYGGSVSAANAAGPLRAGGGGRRPRGGRFPRRSVRTFAAAEPRRRRLARSRLTSDSAIICGPPSSSAAGRVRSSPHESTFSSRSTSSSASS